MPLALRAFRFAREVHREQCRESDAAPFIIHPLEVASLLHNTGHRDQLVAAGILHDTIEDSTAEIPEIVDTFGSDIAEIVAVMSEDPTIDSFEQRKAGLRRQITEFGPDATAVYAADKVAKVRELRSRATRGEARAASHGRELTRPGCAAIRCQPPAQCLSGSASREVDGISTDGSQASASRRA